MPMAPAMQLLCILGALRSIVATMGPVFLSTGNPGIQTQLSIMQLAIMGILIYPLTLKWGIAGTSTTVVLTNLASYWGIRKVLSLVNSRFKDVRKSLFFPLIGTLIMVLLLFLFKQAFKTNVVHFFLRVVLGGLVYLVAMYLLDRTYPSMLGETFKMAKGSLTEMKSTRGYHEER